MYNLNMCSREKILQTNSKGDVYPGSDTILSQKKLMETLASDLGIGRIEKDNEGWIKFNDFKISLKNISYLGYKKGEVRDYKKRAQFSDKLVPSFTKDRTNKIILGHYINKEGERLYALFTLEKGKVGKSKSSHVSVYDLKNAFQTGGFSKVDARKNYVQVFKPEFLKQKIGESINSNPFKDFAEFIKANYSKLNYKNCYKEMKEKGFKNAKQTMWAGWYLEFLAEGFFNGYSDVITPYTKKIGAWKPDAFYKVPVDMKFHNEDKKDIPGNDYDGVLKAITKYEKISLFVVNGDVVLESDDNEVDKFRNKLFGNTYKGNPNHRKLKKSVTVTEIGWCDIDLKGFQSLKLFKQGKQPNGSLRKPKLMYDVNMLDFDFS